MSARKDAVTLEEGARFAFHQGYLFALDQVIAGLTAKNRCTPDTSSTVDALRNASSSLLAKHAIAKAEAA